MSIKICSVGDVMLGENLYHYHRGIVAKYWENYFELIPKIIRNYVFKDIDVFLLNFEGSLIENKKVEKS